MHPFLCADIDRRDQGIDVGKLSTVLTAKYGSLDEAQGQLGSVNEIQSTFIDFQKYLYLDTA